MVTIKTLDGAIIGIVPPGDVLDRWEHICNSANAHNESYGRQDWSVEETDDQEFMTLDGVRLYVLEA